MDGIPQMGGGGAGAMGGMPPGMMPPGMDAGDDPGDGGQGEPDLGGDGGLAAL